ncbi:MAG: DUF6537 domain-containing protein, partial [Burkholderiaceae bacterium]
RRSLRFHTEHARIREWLGIVRELAPAQPDVALEVVRAQRLVKGYGDTHARGWRSFQRVMGALPQLRASRRGAEHLRSLNQAALADETGQALEQLLARGWD